MTSPRPITGIVFDCDGLLLETETRWTIAEEIVCAENDAEFSMDLKRQMLGSSIPRAGVMLAAWCGRPESEGPRFADELLVAFRRAVDEYGVEPLPGVADFLSAVHGRVPLAVASNNTEEETRRTLSRSTLPDVFSAYRCAGGALPAKPAPDMYLAACAAIGVEPRDAVAFEDSVPGATAAMRAGMRVIGIPSTPGVVLPTPVVLSSIADIDVDDLLAGRVIAPPSADGERDEVTAAAEGNPGAL